MMPEERLDTSDADHLRQLEQNRYLRSRGAGKRARKLTTGRKRAFVALLAEGHSPSGAAREVGVSRQAAYRQRSNDPDFAQAWDEALEMQCDLYEDALRRSAIEGKNIAAVIFSLKNLRSDKWRDRHEVETRHTATLNLGVKDLPPGALAALLPLVQRELRQQQKALPEPKRDGAGEAGG